MSKRAKRIASITLVVAFLAGCANLSIQEKNADRVYTADWESLKNHNPAPDWFRDAKFGIYFHWGVYSVPAFGSEWYPRNMYNKSGDTRRPGPSREYLHHVEAWGEPTKFGYPDFVPMFKAENFNADEWAELFAKAGAHKDREMAIEYVLDSRRQAEEILSLPDNELDKLIKQKIAETITLREQIEAEIAQVLNDIEVLDQKLARANSEN